MWLKCNNEWAIKNNGRMEQMWGCCGETQSRQMKLSSDISEAL